MASDGHGALKCASDLRSHLDRVEASLCVLPGVMSETLYAGLGPHSLWARFQRLDAREGGEQGTMQHWYEARIINN